MLMKSVLKDMIAEHGLPEKHLDALLEYTFSGSNNENEALTRLSFILGQSIPSRDSAHNGLPVELQKHINEVINKRIDALEKQLSDLKNSSPKKLVDTWQIVQAIMTVLAFSGTVLSLFKIFKS